MDRIVFGTMSCLMKISGGDCNLEYRHVLRVSSTKKCEPKELSHVVTEFSVSVADVETERRVREQEAQTNRSKPAVCAQSGASSKGRAANSGTVQPETGKPAHRSGGEAPGLLPKVAAKRTSKES
jgi:hypothetical protein